MRVVLADRGFWKLKARLDQVTEKVKSLEAKLSVLGPKDPRFAKLEAQFEESFKEMLSLFGRLHNYKPPKPPK